MIRGEDSDTKIFSRGAGGFLDIDGDAAAKRVELVGEDDEGRVSGTGHRENLECRIQNEEVKAKSFTAKARRAQRARKKEKRRDLSTKQHERTRKKAKRSRGREEF
jgi:hypothetical protein